MKYTRLLKKGMSGADVKYMQQKLKDKGFAKFTPDGAFGPMSDKAVKDFQRANNLAIDGKVGRITWGNITGGGVTSSTVSRSSNVKVPDMVTSNGLEIFDNILPNGEYVKDTVDKKTIYLHHTAGSGRPDWCIDNWRRDGKPGKPLRVATAYAVGRRSRKGDSTFDGLVYRAFDDKYWAYHLGVKSSTISGAGHNKKSGELNAEAVGIEICNYGYVTKSRDGTFLNYVGSRIDPSDVVELEKPFRGYKFWQTYTDAQIENVRKLLVYLIDKYDIEIEHGIYNAEWFEYDSDKFIGTGLRGHTQVRTDKFDIYPCPKMIKMLNSL